MIKRNESALGVDLSDKTAHYCLMTTADGILAEGRIKLDITKVAELWRELGQYADVVVMEAGTPAAWVRKLLESLGSRVIVADPRKLQAVTAAVRKSDVRDAQMLARIGLADEELLAPTYQRPASMQRAMSLLKVRDQQVRARTATVQEIRSQVKQVGSRMPKCDAAQFHNHEGDVPVALRDVLAPLFVTLRALDQAITALDEKIASEGAKIPAVAQLQKVPGVGPITALAFVAVVGEPARFARTRDIGAYLGLVPRRDQSGVADPARRISKAGCGFLRRLLVQCAQSVCRPTSRTDTTLRRFANRQLERRGKVGKRKVLVAVARKLAVTLLSLWKSGHTWNPLHRAPAPAAVAPKPVVLDECALVACPSEGDTETAPSTTTRTHACTEGESLKKSADGSTGRSGVSASRRVARASSSSRLATPSAPAAPACAGDPAGLDALSVAEPRARRGRVAAQSVA